MSKQILIVDDDELLRQSLAFNLERAGFRAQMAANASDGLLLARTYPPALVLLAVNLPGMDGLEAVQKFRGELGIPVIFVTARRRGLDEVLGLELGADDYVTKPFDNDVLLARIRAVLRSTASSASAPAWPQPLAVGDLYIDPASHMVTVTVKPVNLSPREFRLLYTLAQEASRVVSTEELLQRVWGPGYEGQLQGVYVHIRWLREKLEADPQKPSRIVTVRGVGYKLVPQEE